MKKIPKIIISFFLIISNFFTPVYAESNNFALGASTSITFWLSTMGLRFFSNSASFASSLWNLFENFLITEKNFTSEQLENLKAKAEKQKYTYNLAGEQVLQLGSELYNYYSEFKTWLCNRFDITSNSENDKKILFSESDFVNCSFYSSGSNTFYGNNGNYNGYSIAETGFYPIDNTTRPIFENASSGRIGYYNFNTLDGNFSKLVCALVTENTAESFGGGRFHATLGNFNTDDYYPTFSSVEKNGKKYLLYVTFFRDSVPSSAVEGIKTFTGDFNAWGDFWYEATYGGSAYTPNGEAWAKDLVASPSTVEKGATATVGETFETGESMEEWLKNILAASYPTTFPNAVASSEAIEAPSEISEGEISANWNQIFPFSLPYDFYLLCNLFVAEPVRPEFDIKIFGQTFSYDLSALDPAIEIFRTCISISFIAGLIWATREVLP